MYGNFQFINISLVTSWLVHHLGTPSFGTFRTSSKLQAFDSLNQFRPLIFHITYRSRYRVPDEMVGRYCSVDCYLFGFLSAYILAHPFACCYGLRARGIGGQNQSRRLLVLNSTSVKRLKKIIAF